MLRIASFLPCIAVALATVTACDGSLESGLEVLPQDSLAVLLSESNGIPIGVLAEQRILAGKQHVLLSRPNREGRQTGKDRLPALHVSPGPQRLDLGDIDDEEPIVVVFEAVAEDEVVGIELLHPNEEELQPGTWVEVDVVGVTRDGAHVRSIHPRFQAGENTHLGYFAYRFDPDAEPQTLNVVALDRQIRAEFRGLARNKAKPVSVLKR